MSRRGQLREVTVVTARKREAFETLGVEELRYAGGGGIHDTHLLSGYGHALLRSFELQSDVEGDGGADVDDDIFYRGGCKVGGIHKERVGAGSDGLKIVTSVSLRIEFTLQAGGRTRKSDLCTWNTGVRHVVNDAVHSAAFEGLRGSAGYCEEQCTQRKHCVLPKC